MPSLYNIGQLLAPMTSAEKTMLDKTITFTPNSEQVTISISGSDIVTRLLQMYSTFKFVHCNTVTDFITFYNNWYSTFEHSLKLSAIALYTEYKPLENFDRYEDEYTDTSTPYGGSTSTTKSDTYTGSSADMSETTTNISQGTHTDTKHGKQHLHGNIGVTKSQDMVKSEIELRMSCNIIDLIITAIARDEIF